MRELAFRTGINRAVLSFAEQGRLIPSGEEFARVMAVLAAAEHRAGGLSDTRIDPEEAENIGLTSATQLA